MYAWLVLQTFDPVFGLNAHLGSLKQALTDSISLSPPVSNGFNWISEQKTEVTTRIGSPVCMVQPNVSPLVYSLFLNIQSLSYNRTRYKSKSPSTKVILYTMFRFILFLPFLGVSLHQSRVLLIQPHTP